MYEWVLYVYFAGMVLSAVSLAVVIYQKPSREQNVATLIVICCGFIWMGYWVGIQSTSVEQLIIGKKLNYLGACNVYFALILFYIKYYRIYKYKFSVTLLGLIGLAFTAITFTMDKHTWYYKSFAVDTSGPFIELAKEYGPLHTAYVVMVIIYSGIALAITIAETKKKSLHRADIKNSIALLSIVIVPSACYIAEKISHPVIHIVPFGLLFTNASLIYLIGGNRICDINILAREYLYDSIDDGIIVIDENMNYKDANNLAKELYPMLEHTPIGASISSASEEISQLIQSETKDKKERYLEIENKVYRTRLKQVKTKKRVTGYVLWLEDVTAESNSRRLIENYQKDLESEVSRKTAQLKNLQIQMVNGFAAIVENKNLITGDHIQRTSGYVDAIARELKRTGKFEHILTDSYLKKLKMAAPLHDIGKVSIPDQILDKPDKLTKEEFEIIKTHSMNGAKIIEKTMAGSDDKEYFEMAKEVARYHHEKWDGNGYPSGLAGADIPLDARIMAVADVFDALVSERPYKRPYTLPEAFDIICNESGSHFDPEIVEAFLNIKAEIEEMHTETLCIRQKTG